MTERSALARLPVLALASIALPWGGQEGAPVQDTSPIRLLDRLDTARIESPLAGLESAPDLAALEEADKDLLLEEGFEDFDWSFAGWPRVPEVQIVAEGEGHVLRVDGPSDASLGWIVPVQADSFYRFERSVRVRGEPFCDLYVVESRSELENARLDARNYFLAGRGEALKVHGVALRPEAGEGWQRGSTSFYPTPRTRSLVVIFRGRVGADPGTKVQGMSFDDVRLEEVWPDREERMRLLKGMHHGPGANPALGMRKAGWLLPLPSPEGAQKGEPAESNYDWREALYAPPTTELAFALTFPAGARLRLATGLARESPPGSAARFQIELVRAGSEPERLLDVVRAARMDAWHWEELDLDLSAHAGSAGTLVLRTTAETGDPHPLWANPRLESAAGAADPLVILIAVDTLRADRLSAYGYERPTTPALDRLAAEGVRFDQARSNCNWTCPSFASIFTGLVPARHGVTSYGPATPLPDELVTLAEHFQARGWATRSIAYKVPLFDGNYEQGFDQAFNVPRDVIRGEENLARALEWLETVRGGPSFLFLHFNDPHQPFVHPEPLGRTFGGASTGLDYTIPDGSQAEQRARFSNLYDGAVAYVDSCIGRFLDALRERGLYERASIAFVADHGEQLWEHGRFGHGGLDLYDEIVRVPLIVKPPATTFQPGRVVTADVSGFDVMPTLLDLAGVPPRATLDARSLVPLIRGVRERLDRPVVTETSGRGMALVDGGFKYVVELYGRSEALFDLTGDPKETKDIVAERPSETARLRALAIAYLLEHRPGNYLLANPGEAPVRLRVSTPAVRALLGPEPQIASTDEPGVTAVDLEAGAWTLLEIEDPDAARVAVHGLESRSVAGFEPWTAGRFVSLEGAGLWRFHGPEPRAHVDTSSEPVDAELLEALRKLGYTE